MRRMQKPHPDRQNRPSGAERHAALARAEAARMREAAQGAGPEARIRVTREHFLWLADLLDHLAHHGPQGCDDPECFSAAQRGIRFWVPVDHVERELAELARLRETDRNRASQILPPRLAH